MAYLDLDYYPSDGGAPLGMRSSTELEDILHKREALVRQLEAEAIALQQPSDLEERVAAIEDALACLEDGSWDDPAERNASIAALVKDIDAPSLQHFHFESRNMDALTGYRKSYMSNTPRVAESAQGTYRQNEHPARREAVAPEPPQQQSDYIGRKGAFAEAYQFVRDPWSIDGGYVAQVPNYYGNSPEALQDNSWRRAQADLDRFNRFEDRVTAKVASQAGRLVTMPAAVAEFVHEMQDYRDHLHPETIAPGCGDVYTDLARAPIEQRSMRREMGRCGVPVNGQPPPVTREWLRSSNIWRPDPEREISTQRSIGRFSSARSLASSNSVAVDRLGEYKRGMLE